MGNNKTNVTLPGMGEYFTEESFKVLRTNLQFCGKDVKLVALTSCEMNEGKTVVSLHLGVSLAQLGKKVLVIDADMRKSVMEGRNTDAKNAKGLSEYLSGMCELSDCVYDTQYNNLHIMFAGKYPPNPVELLGGKYFADFLQSAKNIYDYVIIDTPPLGMVIDAAVIASVCDSAILVVGNSSVRTSQAKDVVAQLSKSGCNVLGVVLNNAENKRRSYYKYRYRYKRYYKSQKYNRYV